MSLVKDKRRTLKKARSEVYALFQAADNKLGDLKKLEKAGKLKEGDVTKVFEGLFNNISALGESYIEQAEAA